MNNLLLALLVLALAVIEFLCSGTRFALSIPAYGILSLAAILSLQGSLQTPVSKRQATCIGVSGFFFAYVLLRSFLSPVDYLARRDIYMVLAALIVYLLVALRITSTKQRSLLVGFLLLLALAQCVVGTIQFSTGNNFMIIPFLPRSEQYGSRASGFYMNPNHLAGFLEIALFMGLGVTFFSRWKLWGKILAGYASCVCIAGILMTGSRGGYLSSLGGLLAFSILGFLTVARHHYDRALKILAALTVVALLGVFGVYHVVKNSDLVGSRVQIIAKDEVRIQFAQAALEQFKLSPWIGTGSGTFLYYGRLFRPKGSKWDPTYAHNDYLHFLAEYGVVGMVGMLLFLFVHLHMGWKSFHEMTEARSRSAINGSNSLALTVGALSVVAAYLVHSAFDFNLHIPGNTLLMAVVFGLLANPSSSLRPPGRTEPEHPLLRYIPLVIPLLGAWLGFIAVTKFAGEFYNEKSSAALRVFDLSIESFNFKDGEKFAEMALRFERRNPDIYYNLGESKVGLAESVSDENQKRLLYNQALDAYNKGLELFPLDVRLLFCKGWALDALKCFDEAEEVFRRAVALDPNSGTVRASYADHLYKMGKLDEAERCYKEAIERGAYDAASFGLKRIAEDRKAMEAKKTIPKSENAN